MLVLLDITEIRRYRRKQEELMEEVELSNKRMTLANEVGKVAWWEWNYDKKSWFITLTMDGLASQPMN